MEVVGGLVLIRNRYLTTWLTFTPGLEDGEPFSSHLQKCQRYVTRELAPGPCHPEEIRVRLSGHWKGMQVYTELSVRRRRSEAGGGVRLRHITALIKRILDACKSVQTPW